MPNFHRYFVPNGTYFFTVVTDGRYHLFSDQAARTLLGNLIRACQSKWPFTIQAIVLLPDHLHTIWSLPPGDDAFPRRWGWLKKEFSKAWLVAGNRPMTVSEGRLRDGRVGVWQPKYWEHLVRDENDFERLADYIHYNPVKHGYVQSPSAWGWSSFHRWVDAGVYDRNWSTTEPVMRFGPVAEFVGE
jgi:putative transposase